MNVRALQFIGMFAVNACIVYSGWREARKNHNIYNSLPEEEQRKIYDNCILQKVGESQDGLSAIQERMATKDPDSHMNIEPRKPYQRYL